MFKKFVLVFSMLVVTHVYADDSAAIFTKYADQVGMHFEKREFVQCIVLIDR